MTRLSAALFGVVVLLASVDAQRATQPSISELLDAYNRRDFAGAVQAGVSLPSIEGWQEGYPREAGTWIDAEKSQTVRRRLVAAALLIEVARERFATALTSPKLFVVAGWACEQLRKSPPSTGELAWHHAVVAFVGYAGDPNLLTVPGVKFGLAGRPVWPCVDPVKRQSYLDYVERRFSTDRRPPFQRALLQVTAIEIEMGRPARPTGDLLSAPLITGATAASSGFRTSSTPPPPLPTRFGPSSARDTTTAIRLLEPFRADADVGGEAEGHIAYLHLMRRNFASALDHASAALTMARDTQTRYLAQVFRGRALEGLGRPVEARDAYLGALDAMPDGESAALLLAVLNSSLLPSSDMVARAEAALVQAPRDQDPVRRYAYGDYIRWQTYVDALHAALP